VLTSQSLINNEDLLYEERTSFVFADEYLGLRLRLIEGEAGR